VGHAVQERIEVERLAENPDVRRMLEVVAGQDDGGAVFQQPLVGGVAQELEAAAVRQPQVDRISREPHR
jgi:hypothetical protein